MSHNYEGIVLFWLLPSTSEQADLRADINALQKIIIDTRNLFDVDQCIDELAAITDQTIFLILGPTRSDLLPILHTFDYLRYIYLSEPHEYTQHTSQVRGVFPTINQLLPQLSKDVRMAQQNDSHLIVTQMGDPTQSHRSITDLQSFKGDFQWRQTLIDIVLDAPPPQTTNIHKDLIDEWRLVYRSNIAQTRFIDEFEKEYDPSKAISWYTRTTFLFQMVNAALRTENIVIIWRLRFYIQDLYRQLQRMHAEQNKTSTGTQQQIQTLYRGQLMFASEVTQLKKCVGGTIAMTSFVSTSKNPCVAEMFAGNGEHRAEKESVMFEIIIDQSEYERSPFADISAMSSEPHEEEVLLCLGTTLRIESVEVRKQVTWVRMHMCQREENRAPRQIIQELDKMKFDNSNANEIVSLSQLLTILFYLEEFRKMRQVLKVMKSLVDPSMNPEQAIWLDCQSLGAEFGELDPTDTDYSYKCQMLVKQLQKLTRSILDSRPNDNHLLDPFLSMISFLNDLYQTLPSNYENFDLSTACTEYYKCVEKCSVINLQPAWDMVFKRKINPALEIQKMKDRSIQSMTDVISQAYHDETCSEKDPDRITWCWHLANAAFKKSDYDEAIRLLREGLAIPSDKILRVELYRRLLLIFFEQENWLAAIECCQDIVNMPQLPSNSPFLVEAHMMCASACEELNDYSEALLSYTKALELQHRHHPPRHPRTADVHVKLGTLFVALDDSTTALEHFQIAIALDSPKSTTEAQEKIARIYKRMKRYEEARAHLFQSLDIRRRHFPSKTVQLARTYLLLIEIEHITGHQQQRDLYLQQASQLVDSSEEARDLFSEETRRILQIPSPTIR